MATIDIDVTAASDVDPYTLPAGLTGHKNTFRISSHKLYGQSSGDGEAYALVDSPVTSGDLIVDFTIFQSSDTYNDDVGAIFCDTSGNGYMAYLSGPEVYIYGLAAFDFDGSTLAYYGSTTVSAGAAFRCKMNITTGLISWFENSVSTTVPTVSYLGTYSAGMANGFLYFYFNNGDGGYKTLSLNKAAGGASVRALVLSSGVIKQITDAQLGTGLKPIVLYNGELKQRSAAEGVAVIIDTGVLREISGSETLLL